MSMTASLAGGVEATNLRDLVRLRAAEGDKPLLICQGETLTYRDADLLSNRVANALAALGVGKGDVVATLMYNSIAQALVWFGCAKIGAVYAPLNVSLVAEDLTYSLDDSAAAVLVVDEEVLPAYEACAARLRRPPAAFVHRGTAAGRGARAFEELLEADDDCPDVVVGAIDPACIVYTGGSTSMPKGVLVPHFYYTAAALRYREITRATPDDVHFANSHFFHIGGQQFGVTGPLYSRMTGVMAKWFSASRYWDDARRYGATIIDPLGTMIAVLERRPPSPQDRDHRVRAGVGIASGQVRRDVRDRFEQRFGIPLLEVYSMTEMGVMICSERFDDRRPGSSGRPHGWADIRIVDEHDVPLRPGETGQILIRPHAPNSCMLRYVNKPDETIAAWQNLWYHSGDLGYMDEDGYVFFVGRQAHWIRRRGENVSAFEVEQVLTAHPAVVDCAVVGVTSDLGEEDVKAYVQVQEGSAGDVAPEAIVDWCRERIAMFKVPRYVEFVDAFPRTLTKNEIARHELRDRGVGDAWDAQQISAA